MNDSSSVGLLEAPLGSFERRSAFRPSPLNSRDLSAERHRAILRILAEQGRVTVAELASRFEISAATARRDAIFLADMGRAVRRHGGLVSGNTGSGEQHFLARGVMDCASKNYMGRRAADLLPHRGSIFVDAGTSCLAVGRILISRPELRVYTNSIPLLALAAEAKASLISIGGEARKASLAMIGGFSQAWVADLRFDAAVFGAAGLDAVNGAYTSELHEAAIKSEALRRSVQRVLIAGSEKMSRPSTVRFAPWSAFSTFVTNREMGRETLVHLAANKVALCVAKPG